MLVRWLCMLCGVFLAISVGAQAELPGQFSDELEIDHYDCALTLQPAATLTDTSSVRVLLEATSPTDAIVVTLNKHLLAISAGKGAALTPLAQVAAGVIPGHPYHLTIMRRGATLGLMHEQTVLCRATVPHAHGKLAAVTAQSNWRIDASTIQREAPVLFADDFTRTADDDVRNQRWTTASGTWMLQSVWDSYIFSKDRKFNYVDSAQNPFSWIGIGAPGLCTVSDTSAPTWEDYTFNVAVQPSEGTTAGIMFNMADVKNGLLVRWSSAHDRGPLGNRLTLSRVTDGVARQLAVSPGGFVAGQWYELTAESNLDGVRVLLDGRERLAQKNLMPWRGGVGLYTAGAAGTVFNDVTVYGHTINGDLQQEAKQTHLADKFVTDENGMQQWASANDAWVSDGATPAWRWYNEDLYGTHAWAHITIQRQQGDGTTTLILNGDGASHTSGYRAVAHFTETPAATTYTLYDGEVKLAEKTGDALDHFTDYDLRFWRIGSQLKLEVDDAVVVAAPCRAARATLRPAYGLDGAVTQSNITALTDNRYNYTFADEPSAWRAVGDWAPSIRWPCQPEWSFLSGWSQGEAILWHKQVFSGDQTLSYFAGVKMEYPRDQQSYHKRFPGFFGATICGDGQDPHSGYCGIFGAADETGTPYHRAQLLRNGVVVVSLPIDPPTDWNDNHHNWFDIRLEKHGARITFTVVINHQTTTVPYTDAHPLSSGRMAIWTSNNGISLARACLDFAQLPVTPPPDPQVLIDHPWYPEWQNLHQPITLTFYDSWATSGQPVTLSVKPRAVPAGDEKAAVLHGNELVGFPGHPGAVLHGNQLVVTPAHTGAHWYEVTGGDGATHSAGFHFSLPVFDASLKRDDSHALVLYRFDEGSGQVVHDQSKIAPALDLHLPAKATAAHWLPGQGLALDGTGSLTSSTTTEKLMKLADKRACTLEFWMSMDTLYASQDARFNTCYACWGTTGGWGSVNFSVGSYYTFFFADSHAYTHHDFMDQSVDGARTSLHHFAFTWDGFTTTMYVDGEFQGRLYLPWGQESWNATDAVLALGNNLLNAQPFIGAYYLFAIHDRCFNNDEIRHNYLAGPAAQ